MTSPTVVPALTFSTVYISVPELRSIFSNMIYDLKNPGGSGTALVQGIRVAGVTTVRLM